MRFLKRKQNAAQEPHASPWPMPSVRSHPTAPAGGLWKSIALHALDRVQEAFDLLVPVVDKFSHVPAMAYDLACYACRLNRVDEAWGWLEKVIEADGTDRFRAMALGDLDLKPLWPRLQR